MALGNMGSEFTVPMLNDRWKANAAVNPLIPSALSIGRKTSGKVVWLLQNSV
jgi:hypothetical protein